VAKTQDHKGRGATLSPDNRYSDVQYKAVDNGWHQDEQPDQFRTQLFIDTSKKNYYL